MTKSDAPGFDQSLIDDVVDHMNHDHNDACLAIVQAFSGNEQATKVELVTFDHETLGFLVHHGVQTSEASIRFLKPIARPEQIRGAFVGLTKAARQKLLDEKPVP